MLDTGAHVRVGGVIQVQKRGWAHNAPSPALHQTTGRSEVANPPSARETLAGSIGDYMEDGQDPGAVSKGPLETGNSIRMVSGRPRLRTGVGRRAEDVYSKEELEDRMAQLLAQRYRLTDVPRLRVYVTPTYQGCNTALKSCFCGAQCAKNKRFVYCIFLYSLRRTFIRSRVVIELPS